MLYVLRESSFISIQFFVLNLHDLFGVLPKKFISFWYSIIKPWYSSQIIILSFFWIYIYISFFRFFFFILNLFRFICNCFWNLLWWSFGDFIILSAILLPITSLVEPVVFGILSSISSSLEFWLVNHTSIYENFEFKGFRNI